MALSDKAVTGGSFLLGPVQAGNVFTAEDFTDEQRMIAKTTHDFVQKEVIPKDEEIESRHLETTVSLLKKAGELGLLGADVPEPFGGLGLDKVSSSLISEYMSPGSSFALAHGAHVGIGTLPIVFFGSREQKEKYLPALATGEKLAAYALTEPGSGSDALGAKTKAVLSDDGSHYILNGSKLYITNAGFADIFIVYAKIDGDKFSAFIVERDTPGFSIGPEEKKMGIKGSSTCPLSFEDACVPAENLLGEIGRGHVIAFNILNMGRYKLGVGVLGSAKEAIELASKFANQRVQFGRPISAFPIIREKLADMNIRTFALESMVYRTGGLVDERLGLIDFDSDEAGRESARGIEEYALECSIIKVFGTEALDFVVDEGVQIHGGCGFIQEYKIERMYRDSRINRIFEGTNEINRLLIPGMLFKKAMKGDLPLLAAAKQLQSELLSMMPNAAYFEAPLEREHHLISMAKKVFLMTGGLAVQKYQQALEREQEVLSGLADLIISIYAMESAALRAQKTLDRQGPDKAQHQIDMAQVFVYETFNQLDPIAKKLLAAMDEGDTLRTHLSLLKRLAKTEPLNTVRLKRSIAARIVDAERYVV